MTGVELIAAERERHATAEGWTPEHDDGHAAGELAYAACAYAYPNAMVAAVGGDAFSRERFWPFSEPFNGTDSPRTAMEGARVRELAKAGALIAAEIDRLHRAPVSGGSTP
jgi:hypothetical protein